MKNWQDLIRGEGPPHKPHLEPPKAVEDLLGLFLSDEDRDAVLGDLVEMHDKKVLSSRRFEGARIWYWRQVIFSIAYFAWIRVRRVAMMRSMMRSLKAIGVAIAGFYVAVALCNAMLMLPIVLLTGKLDGITIGPFDTFKIIVSGMRGYFWQSGTGLLLYQCWISVVGPVLIMAVGALALHVLKGWLRFLSVYLILCASAHLMSFVFMLATLDDGGWIGNWLSPSKDLRACRIVLSILMGLLIIFANSWAFQCLFQDAANTWMIRLGRFAGMFLLPTSIVPLIMITMFWSLSLGSPMYFRDLWNPMFLEIYAICWLPGLIVGALAMSLLRHDGRDHGPIAT